MSVVESTVVEASPFVVARAAVRSVELLSPSFARITFGGADLDEFGDPERILDQRERERLRRQVKHPGPSRATRPEDLSSDESEIVIEVIIGIVTIVSSLAFHGWGW